MTLAQKEKLEEVSALIQAAQDGLEDIEESAESGVSLRGVNLRNVGLSLTKLNDLITDLAVAQEELGDVLEAG